MVVRNQNADTWTLQVFWWLRLLFRCLSGTRLLAIYHHNHHVIISTQHHINFILVSYLSSPPSSVYLRLHFSSVIINYLFSFPFAFCCLSNMCHVKLQSMLYNPFLLSSFPPLWSSIPWMSTFNIVLIPSSNSLSKCCIQKAPSSGMQQYFDRRPLTFQKKQSESSGSPLCCLAHIWSPTFLRNVINISIIFRMRPV